MKMVGWHPPYGNYANMDDVVSCRVDKIHRFT